MIQCAALCSGLWSQGACIVWNDQLQCFDRTSPAVGDDVQDSVVMVGEFLSMVWTDDVSGYSDSSI